MYGSVYKSVYHLGLTKLYHMADVGRAWCQMKHQQCEGDGQNADQKKDQDKEETVELEEEACLWVRVYVGVRVRVKAWFALRSAISSIHLKTIKMEDSSMDMNHRTQD